MIKISGEGKAWLNVLARSRVTIRKRLAMKENLFHQGHLLRRQANKLIATGNRFNERRAERLNLQADTFFEQARELNLMLIEIGELLMMSAKFIDAEIPQPVLLDFLEVNLADRCQVEPSDGFINLTFVKSLEYSACTRGSDFASGPFYECFNLFMQNELMTNYKLQDAADELLFGEGGMFENVPTYKMAANGEMIRQPLRLRLVK